jgi:hypothetical protein
MTARKREIVLRLSAGEYDALSWLAKAYQSTPEFMLRWYISTIRTDPMANPMAQPPGPPLLTKRIALRVEQAMWRKLLRQSGLFGLTPSEYVRDILASILASPPVTTAQVDAALREVYAPDTFSGSWGTTMTNSTDGSVAAEAARSRKP